MSEKQATSFLRNNTSAARTVTWDNGNQAFTIGPYQSVAADKLPDGFKDLQEVQELLRLKILEQHKA